MMEDIQTQVNQEGGRRVYRRKTLVRNRQWIRLTAIRRRPPRHKFEGGDCDGLSSWLEHQAHSRSSKQFGNDVGEPSRYSQGANRCFSTSRSAVISKDSVLRMLSKLISALQSFQM